MNISTWRDLVSGRTRGALPGLIRCALLVLSLPYSALTRARRWLYDTGMLISHRAGVPVICVGNVTAGGVGKTPLVELILRDLRGKSWQVGLLARGYGKRGPDDLNDEARMLRSRMPDLPVVLNPDRVAGASALAKQGVNLVVMDDGFSHRRLARDIDLIVIDATNPWGWGHLLPRGALREPVSSLKRAWGVVISRSDQVALQELQSIRARCEQEGVPGNRVWLSRHAPTCIESLTGGGELPLSKLKGISVGALCGIGNPDAFFNTLEGLGARIVMRTSLPDHFDFNDGFMTNDLPRILEVVRRSGGEALVITEKDAVKLRGRLGPDVATHIWVLVVSMEIEGGSDALVNAIDADLKARRDGSAHAPR